MTPGSFGWLTFWLIVHVFSAIVAFGPSFVFPVVAPLIQRNPEHALFGYEAFERIENRLIIPVALTMPISGIGLLATARIDFFNTTWLTVGVGLYVVALGLAIGHQVPATRRIIGLLRTAGAPAGGAPPGPPQGLQMLVNRTRMVGMALGVLLLAIVVLMIWEPGTTTYRT